MPTGKRQLETSTAPLSLLLRRFADRKRREAQLTTAERAATVLQRATSSSLSMLRAITSDPQVASTLACLQMRRRGSVCYTSHEFK